jgi:CBS domain-containing protein
MNIADVMTPDLDTVSPSDTLKTAARLMADLDSGALPVGEDNRLIGTITDHDIAMQVAAQGLDPGKTTVGEAMSSDVLYCFDGESVEEVSEKMRGWWVRRLPVVSCDKRLIGVVSLGDLTALKAQPRPKVRSRRAPRRPAAVVLGVPAVYPCTS